MTNSFLASAFLGTAMPLELTRSDLAIRLVCALIAGVVIGVNRGEAGKAAGLRTTILVCMAASVAMLQMNYLLTLAGRGSGSFVMNDLMRLPLGILTGVGFIGGGAILRRGKLVIGVTTAATLWYVTVIGLCFGGGQVLLGWIATAIGLFVLWGLRCLEDLMPAWEQGHLTVTVGEAGPSENEIRQHLLEDAFKIDELELATRGQLRTYRLSVRKRQRPSENSIPLTIETLSRHAGVTSLKWRHFE